MRNEFLQTMTDLAVKDKSIMFLTGDLGFKIFDDYISKCPKQFLNVGVAEQSMLGVAMGMALEGRTVMAYSIGNFHTFRALEQIRNDVCYHQANVKIISTGAGFSYGQLGMSHHATEDLSVMRALPHMNVLAPGCSWESEELTKIMLSTDGPFYMRLDNTTAGNTRQDGEEFVFGKIRQVKDGQDITLITAGGILKIALEAADKLAKDGIKCRVLSANTLKPFDEQTVIKAAKETGGIITIEENVVEGGLGGAVAEALAENNVSAKAFQRLGLKNTFSTIVGSQDYLRKHYGLDTESIVEQVKKILK